MLFRVGSKLQVCFGEKLGTHNPLGLRARVHIKTTPRIYIAALSNFLVASPPNGLVVFPPTCTHVVPW